MSKRQPMPQPVEPLHPRSKRVSKQPLHPRSKRVSKQLVGPKPATGSNHPADASGSGLKAFRQFFFTHGEQRVAHVREISRGSYGIVARVQWADGSIEAVKVYLKPARDLELKHFGVSYPQHTSAAGARVGIDMQQCFQFTQMLDNCKLIKSRIFQAGATCPICAKVWPDAPAKLRPIHFHVAMPLMTGTLESYLRGKPVDGVERVDIALHLLQSLECLRSSGYFYMDMKLDNVLVKERAGEAPQMFLGDVGSMCRRKTALSRHAEEGKSGAYIHQRRLVIKRGPQPKAFVPVIAGVATYVNPYWKINADNYVHLALCTNLGNQFAAVALLLDLVGIRAPGWSWFRNKAEIKSFIAMVPTPQAYVRTKVVWKKQITPEQRGQDWNRMLTLFAVRAWMAGSNWKYYSTATKAHPTYDEGTTSTYLKSLVTSLLLLKKRLQPSVHVKPLSVGDLLKQAQELNAKMRGTKAAAIQQVRKAHEPQKAPQTKRRKKITSL
ncbi:hypothetical protein OAM67_01020 [bacterium]|nr:hypothetical protein [bacterium]